MEVLICARQTGTLLTRPQKSCDGNYAKHRSMASRQCRNHTKVCYHLDEIGDLLTSLGKVRGMPLAPIDTLRNNYRLNRVTGP